MVSGSSPREFARISINKLGEYMTAHPGRRRKIVQDQKYPSDFVVARYSSARDAIIQHLLGQIDDSGVIAIIDSLGETVATTPWQEQDAQLSAEALEAYLDIDDHGLDVEALRVGEPSAPRFEVGGVEVSVRPDLLAAAVDGRGRDVVGGVKLHVSKTNTLDDEAGEYVATILHQWAESELTTDGGIVDRRLCVVIDVFGKRSFVAPRSHIQRMRRVEAACEEIALRWGSV